MKGKKNPVRQLRESDIRRIKKEARDEGARGVTIMFLTVMRDNEGYGAKRINRVYEGMEYLADSISRGYVKLADLEQALKEEADIIISP